MTQSPNTFFSWILDGIKGIWDLCKQALETVVAWTTGNREFAKSVIVGTAAATAAAHLPLIGGFCAAAIFVLGILHGLCRQVDADLQRAFSQGYPRDPNDGYYT